MTGLRIYKKIVDILADIVYIMILLYAFVAIPYLFGYTPMVVLSASMDKAYSKGSIIYYSETTKDNLKVGDVITFTYDNSEELITHRINAIDGEKYHTKGDANETEDPVLIEFSNIKGEVAKVYIPYLGYIAKYIKEHPYLLVIAALILIAEFILNNLKIFNKKKQPPTEEDPAVKEFIQKVKKEQELEKKHTEEKQEEIEKEQKVIEEEVIEQHPISESDIELPLPKDENINNEEVTK